MKQLKVYLTDGWLAIDNNPTERCMGSIALGRKTSSSTALIRVVNAQPLLICCWKNRKPI
ncbi:MAG: transposase [Kordiimonadaceae bacterium]|nr:transposase [Kordiimonadaceae bacterium]